jgi:hypothetical protein
MGHKNSGLIVFKEETDIFNRQGSLTPELVLPGAGFGAREG